MKPGSIPGVRSKLISEKIIKPEIKQSKKSNMAVRGGKRPGAGRKAGIKSKITKARTEKVIKLLASGSTPLDAMLRKMNWHLGKADREIAKGNAADMAVVEAALDKADEAAKGAAPYTHPRLAAIEHMGKGGGPIEISDAKERLAHILSRHASGGPGSGGAGESQ